MLERAEQRLAAGIDAYVSLGSPQVPPPDGVVDQASQSSFIYSSLVMWPGSWPMSHMKVVKVGQVPLPDGVAR